MVTTSLNVYARGADCGKSRNPTNCGVYAAKYTVHVTNTTTAATKSKRNLRRSQTKTASATPNAITPYHLLVTSRAIDTAQTSSQRSERSCRMRGSAQMRYTA